MQESIDNEDYFEPTDIALQQDKGWQYNKNFIDWVVGIAKESVNEGGLADDMIISLKQQSIDSIINLKDGAKKYLHRKQHMMNAIRTIRRLS